MKKDMKAIYTGVTNDHFTHLEKYRIIQEYSTGDILVLTEGQYKKVMFKGTFVKIEI